MNLFHGLGDQQQVIPPEAISGLPLFDAPIMKEASEGGVVADTALCRVLPNSSLDGAEADFVDGTDFDYCVVG